MSHTSVPTGKTLRKQISSNNSCNCILLVTKQNASHRHQNLYASLHNEQFIQNQDYASKILPFRSCFISDDLANQLPSSSNYVYTFSIPCKYRGFKSSQIREVLNSLGQPWGLWQYPSPCIWKDRKYYFPRLTLLHHSFTHFLGAEEHFALADSSDAVFLLQRREFLTQLGAEPRSHLDWWWRVVHQRIGPQQLSQDLLHLFLPFLSACQQLLSFWDITSSTFLRFLEFCLMNNQIDAFSNFSSKFEETDLIWEW